MTNVDRSLERGDDFRKLIEVWLYERGEEMNVEDVSNRKTMIDGIMRS